MMVETVYPLARFYNFYLLQVICDDCGRPATQHFAGTVEAEKRAVKAIPSTWTRSFAEDAAICPGCIRKRLRRVT